MYKVETEFGTYNVTIKTGKYLYGDNLAIELITDTIEPFAKLTVNLAEWTLPNDKALVEANCGYLKIGDRHPNPSYQMDGNQLRFIV